MSYRFDDCPLDTRRLALFRGGEPCHVEPQVSDLLMALARRAGETVSKEDLVAEVWKGLAISDAAISARVSAARSAVGDDGATQRIIRTVPRPGFCMVAEVEKVGEAVPGQSLPEPLDIRYAASRDGSAIGCPTWNRMHGAACGGH